jgi:hypothetical protein
MRKVYKPLPPVEVVRELFDYSIITGELYYKIRRGMRGKVGASAGAPNHSGRWYVDVYGERYARARIVWLLITGDDCGEVVVEHKNRDKGCDAWHNLRLESDSNNGVNREHKPNQFGERYIYKRISKGHVYYQVVFRRKGIKTITSHMCKTLDEAIDWKQRNVTTLLNEEGFLL